MPRRSDPITTSETRPDTSRHGPSDRDVHQGQLFFSILERRLLRNGEFASVDDLADRLIAFINDYNRRARPFRWTYDGRPLKVA